MNTNNRKPPSSRQPSAASKIAGNTPTGIKIVPKRKKTATDTSTAELLKPAEQQDQDVQAAALGLPPRAPGQYWFRPAPSSFKARLRSSSNSCFLGILCDSEGPPHDAVPAIGDGRDTQIIAATTFPSAKEQSRMSAAERPFADQEVALLLCAMRNGTSALEEGVKALRETETLEAAQVLSDMARGTEDEQAAVRKVVGIGKEWRTPLPQHVFRC